MISTERATVRRLAEHGEALPALRRERCVRLSVSFAACVSSNSNATPHRRPRPSRATPRPEGFRDREPSQWISPPSSSCAWSQPSCSIGSSYARNDTQGPCTSAIDLIAADDLSRPLGAGARGSTHERRPLAVLWAAQAVAWTAPRLSNTAIALVGVVKSFSIPKWH